ncbi:citrate/2-methylcitrate synthase [Escherichia coli]
MTNSPLKTKLKALRGLPANVRTVLEALPAASHPMDVMRTGVSALGCTLPERRAHCLWRAGYCRQTARHRLSSFSFIGITTVTTANASSRKPMTTPSAVTSCICCTAKSHRKAGKGDAYLAGAVRRTRV